MTFSTPETVWGEHAARSAVPLGIPAARWHEVLDESWSERAAGTLGDVRATLRALALRCGADPGADALADACAARMASQRELIQNYRPDVVTTLRSLHNRQVPVGVLSDCTSELADMWPSLPIAGFVAARVLSCEEGRRKPDPELFRLAARRLNVSPEECLYVGDGGGSELTGAAAVGMTAYMLRADDWIGNHAYSREVGWAGASVSSLAEILPLVGGDPALSGAMAARSPWLPSRS